jgi:hypothetical protein
MCDLYIGIEWENEEAMNLFFQFCNDHLHNRYPHLFDQPERLNETDYIVDSNEIVCESLNTANK